MRKHLFLIALVCSIFIACGPKPELPTVTTKSVGEITNTTASCIGEVVDNGNADITSQGFCWSTEQNPTLDNNVIEGGYMIMAEGNCFEAILSGLTAATEYYVRAYATNSEGTAYGENINFVTLEATPEEPETPVDPELPVDPETPVDPEIPVDPELPETQYEYVDLGLPSGVKWATYNIGATKPEEFGEHYAWGEIETKEYYESSNCTSYYKDLGDISGNPEYDVVAAKWGGEWRTPRLEDMYELVTQCEWIWANSGYNVVSKTNGNHIFLPASGFMKGTEVYDKGTFGYYWTSTPYSEEIDGGTNSNTKACYLDFSKNYYITDWGVRRNGFTIRPVFGGKAPNTPGI